MLWIPSNGASNTLNWKTKWPKSIRNCKVLNDENAHIESTIERSFVDTLQGGCQVPIGVKATIIDENLLEFKKQY